MPQAGTPAVCAAPGFTTHPRDTAHTTGRLRSELRELAAAHGALLASACAARGRLEAGAAEAGAELRVARHELAHAQAVADERGEKLRAAKDATALLEDKVRPGVAAHRLAAGDVNRQQQ